MTAQLIAVDATALDALVSEVKALRQEVRSAQIAPRSEWLTIAQAAAVRGVSESTIRRWAADGTIETKGARKNRVVKL